MEDQFSGIFARAWALIRGAWTRMRAVLPDLLLFDLSLSAAVFAVAGPLLAWLFSWFIAPFGRSALGNFEIALRLLSPRGVLFLAVALTLILTFGFLRAAGYLAVAGGARWFTAVSAVISRAPGVCALGLTALGLIAAAALLLLTPPLLTAYNLLRSHDINYYLSQRPPQFWITAAVAMPAVLCLALFACTMFLSVLCALPAVMVGRPAVAALREARALVRSKIGVTVALASILAALWIAAGIFNTVVLYLFGHALVGAAGDRTVILLGVLTVLVAAATALEFLRSLVMGALATVAAAGMVPGTHLALPSEPERIPRLLAVVAAAALLLSAAFGMKTVASGVQFEDRTLIAAHRGSSAHAPENSLSAVRRAIEERADYVEVDIQRTADGVLIVCHDADLMRVGGSALAIHSAPWAQLSAIDIGASKGEEFRGERLPTFDQVIAAGRGKIRFILELKSYGANSSELVRDFVAAFQRHNLYDDAVVMSLKYDEVARVKALDPRITVGFVTSLTIGDLADLNADFYAVSRKQATDLLIASARKQGRKVYVWTIDDERSMSLMVDRGVDAIITNEPAVLRALLDERRALTSDERLLLRFRSIFAP